MKGASKGSVPFPPPPPGGKGVRLPTGGYLAKAAVKKPVITNVVGDSICRPVVGRKDMSPGDGDVSMESQVAERRPEGDKQDAVAEEVDVWLETPPSERFDLEDPAAMDYLDEHGYVVLRDVATVTERERAEELLWEFMAAHAGWDREDPGTWSDSGLSKVSSQGLANGIINKCGSGQSELSWYVRTLPRVRRIFETVWGTEDLITSFDSFGLFRPWHHGFMKTLGGWFHVDQGRLRPGKQCIQGLLSLYDQDLSTGGLTVIPRSHRRFEDDVLPAAADDVDFIAIPDGNPVLEAPHRLIQMEAGDFVLWDSRVVHCNTPAIERPTTPADRLLRAVVYVCMTPKSWASPEIMEKRKTAYEINMTLTHWPHVHVEGFGYGRVARKEFSSAPPERQALIC